MLSLRNCGLMHAPCLLQLQALLKTTSTKNLPLIATPVHSSVDGRRIQESTTLAGNKGFKNHAQKHNGRLLRIFTAKATAVMDKHHTAVSTYAQGNQTTTATSTSGM